MCLHAVGSTGATATLYALIRKTRASEARREIIMTKSPCQTGCESGQKIRGGRRSAVVQIQFPFIARRDAEHHCGAGQTIYANDGVLARRHLKALFWPEMTKQAMEQRLSTLYHNGYLNWPNLEQRRTKPIPEPVVWLGWRG